MKEPLPRGTQIDINRMESWTSEFASYRHGVTERRIERWLRQFSDAHRDIAARVLDCVHYIPYEQIAASFRSLLSSLPGWNINVHQRMGKWRFVAFSVSAGESGDSMLHIFRVANGLATNNHDDLFINMRDLLGENLGPEDSVVFVNDFAGTGNEVCTAWANDVAELLPGGPKIYLVLVAASNAARLAISRATSLTVSPSFELTDEDNIFAPACTHFDDEEKAALLEYCNKADRKSPKGYGDCGFVVVFAHRCPNNSIPILHVDHQTWIGLFRRHH